jgi:Raf kinase inhibitor-like YbhB/YbcL family protein
LNDWHVQTLERSREIVMLEHVPAWLGALLRDRRAGHDKIVAADPDVRLASATMELSSPAFAPGGRLPIRYTADGEGISPPLVWVGVPDEAVSLALIVEDPDAPASSPLVHALVWDIPVQERRIAEGAIVADGAGGKDGDVGRNSFLREGWLPPDPPTGHGEHDYIFQLFALRSRPDLPPSPGRSAFVHAIAGEVLATGVLVGTYSRGEPAQSGTARVAANDDGLAPA